MTARAKTRYITSNDIFSVLLGGFQPKLIVFFLGKSSTKTAQIVALGCTKWVPELKIKKTSNDISAVTTWQISTKLDRIVPWEVLYQSCSNISAPLHKMAARAKNRKKNNFK